MIRIGYVGYLEERGQSVSRVGSSVEFTEFAVWTAKLKSWRTTTRV